MMQEKTASWVSVGLVMVAVLAAGLWIARPLSLSKQAVYPVFMAEEQVVTRTSAQTVSVPAPTPVSAAPLPIFPPKVIYSILPQYPASALSQGLEGTTLLSVYVGLSGAAEKVEIKASAGRADFDESAAAAVKQWRFNPATQGGMAMASCFEIPVRFEVQ